MQSNFNDMSSNEAIEFDSKNNPVFFDINEACDAIVPAGKSIRGGSSC